MVILTFEVSSLPIAGRATGGMDTARTVLRLENWSMPIMVESKTFNS